MDQMKANSWADWAIAIVVCLVFPVMIPVVAILIAYLAINGAIAHKEDSNVD